MSRRKLRKAGVLKAQGGGNPFFQKKFANPLEALQKSLYGYQAGTLNIPGVSLDGFGQFAQDNGIDVPTSGIGAFGGDFFSTMLGIKDQSELSRKLALADQPVRDALNNQVGPYQGNFYAQDGGPPTRFQANTFPQDNTAVNLPLNPIGPPIPIAQADTFDVDPVIMAAIESSMNPNAKGGAGDTGLMQVTPVVVEEYNRVNKTNYSIKDVEENPELGITIGNSYLNEILPKQIKGKGLEDTHKNRVLAYRLGAGGLKKVLKSGKLSKIDQARLDIFNSAEYNEAGDTLTIKRNGRIEKLPIGPYFGKPLEPTYPIKGQQGGQVYLDDKMIMNMSNNIYKDGGSLRVGMGPGGEASVDKLCDDCGPKKRKTRKQRKKKASGEKLTINKDGLYAVDGAVVVPSRELTFQGIDTPTLVLPLPGQDAVLEIPMGRNQVFSGAQGLPQGFGQEVPQANFGGFLKKVGRGIGQGFKGAADLTLSAVGAPNVIDNTFVDNSKFLTGLTNITGGIAHTAANVLAPGIGTLASAGIKGLNAVTAGGRGNPGPGGGYNFSNFGYQGQPQPGFNPMGQQQGGQGFDVNSAMQLFSKVLDFRNGGRSYKYQQGGLVEIQTEKGENIAWPDGSITDVHAKLSHGRMDDDEVTDILPEGTFVGSSYGGIKIDKKDADEIEISTKTTSYSEFETGKEPEVTTLADIVFGSSKKRKMTPADAFNKIKNTFKQVEDGDEFDELTNELNKAGRLPYIEGVIELAEEAKQKKEYNEAIGELEEFVGFDLPRLKKGGRIRRRRKKNVQKAGPGIDISSLINAGTSIAGAIGTGVASRKNRKDLEALLEQGLISYDQYQAALTGAFNDARGYTGLGTAASMASRLAQNPDVRFTENSTGVYDQNIADLRRNNLGNQSAIRNLQQSQVGTQLRNGVDPNTAGLSYGSSFGPMAQSILADNNSTTNSIIQQRLARRQARGQNLTGRDNAFNQGTTNRNSILAGIGSDVQGATQTFANLGLSQAREEGQLSLDRFNTQTQFQTAINQERLNPWAILSGTQIAPTGITIGNTGNGTGFQVGNTPTYDPATGVSTGTPTADCWCGQWTNGECSC